MATNQNVAQLTQQTGTVDPTSLFYAVGSSGSTDTALPLSLLFNSPVFTGSPTVPGYLTSALAASTYLTQANAASNYLSITNAASTYLSQTSAALTYLSITTAASTYATITNLNLKAPLASPTFTGTVTVPTLVPTSITGTTTGTGAAAGAVGEYLTTAGTATSLTSNTPLSVVSLALTAGDYDVWGSVQFTPAGTTTLSTLQCCISTVNNTLQAPQVVQNLAFPTGQLQIMNTAMRQINVATGTTVYVVVYTTFGTSTMTSTASIYARRRR